jgi:hypothetical protein
MLKSHLRGGGVWGRVRLSDGSSASASRFMGEEKTPDSSPSVHSPRSVTAQYWTLLRPAVGEIATIVPESSGAETGESPTSLSSGFRFRCFMKDRA